jgi:hypothetical protein
VVRLGRYGRGEDGEVSKKTEDCTGEESGEGKL